MPTVTRLRGAHSIRSDSTHPARLPGWPFLLTPNQPPPVRSHQGNPRASPEESQPPSRGESSRANGHGNTLQGQEKQEEHGRRGERGVRTGKEPGVCR